MADESERKTILEWFDGMEGKAMIDELIDFFTDTRNLAGFFIFNALLVSLRKNKMPCLNFVCRVQFLLRGYKLEEALEKFNGMIPESMKK